MTEWNEQINPSFGHGQFGRSGGVWCRYTSDDYPGIIREESVVDHNADTGSAAKQFTYITEHGEFDFLSDACSALKLPCDSADEEWDEHVREQAQEASNMRLFEREAESEAEKASERA